MMKIGFDVSQTGASKAGCGFYAHALAQSLVAMAPAENYSFYPSFGDFFLDPAMPLENPYPASHAHYGPHFKTLETAGAFWNEPDLEAKLHHPDIIHANNFWCPTHLKASRLVYTFYDMAFLEEPAWSTDANRLGCFDGIFKAAVSADWIVAISEASRTHFLEVFPHFPKDRIRVIYPCSRFSDPARQGARPNSLEPGLAQKFWLSVGTIEPRKNQLGLAKAYARYREASADPMPLVFAGGKGWLMDDFQRQLSELGISEHVILTGYVSDDELIWLYRNCFANLYPSFFEGFGLPVLEAMQFGAPTLASNTTSIPEVLGTTGPLIGPLDEAGWIQAMLDLENNPERRLIMRAAGEDQAAQFRWEVSTRQLLDLYAEVLDAPKRNLRVAGILRNL